MAVFAPIPRPSTMIAAIANARALPSCRNANRKSVTISSLMLPEWDLDSANHRLGSLLGIREWPRMRECRKLLAFISVYSRLECLRHEDAVRISDVIRERLAIGKTSARVELACPLE